MIYDRTSGFLQTHRAGRSRQACLIMVVLYNQGFQDGGVLEVIFINQCNHLSRIDISVEPA
jgi:hypothetical protein